MTTFKQELEKIIQDLQNGDGFSHAFPKAPLSDRSVAATKAIIELVDREIIGEDVQMKDGSPVNHTLDKLRQKQRQKLGVNK